MHLISERLNCKLLKAVKVCGQYFPVLFLGTSVGANGGTGDTCKSHLVLAHTVSQHGSCQVWGFSLEIHLLPQSQQWWALFVLVCWPERNPLALVQSCLQLSPVLGPVLPVGSVPLVCSQGAELLQSHMKHKQRLWDSTEMLSVYRSVLWARRMCN